MSHPARLTINHEHVNLVTVDGRLDWAGTQDLQRHFDLLLDQGARFVVADLTRAVQSDGRLFGMIARTADLLRYRDGWLRLVGSDADLPAPVLDAAHPMGLVQDVTPG
jgi:hypothetical protein